MKKLFVHLLCMLIPSRSMRKKLRARMLTPTDPKQDAVLYKLDVCLEKMDYLEKMLKATTDIRQLPPAVGDIALIQQAAAAILARFAQLMKKHNIPWWLDSGTLIGYVRHNGYVPWDDDVDVCMMRQDYEKLPELIETELVKEGFSYRGGEIIQIYYGSYRIFIDVFPMDSGYSVIPPTGDEYEHFVAELNAIKATIVFDHEKWRQRKQPVSDEYLRFCKEQRDTKLVKHPLPEGFIFYGVECPVRDRSLRPYNWVFPLQPAKFYGIDIWVPHDTDKYLYACYGDYMSWPRNFATNHGSFASEMTLSTVSECREVISKYLPK